MPIETYLAAENVGLGTARGVAAHIEARPHAHEMHRALRRRHVGRLFARRVDEHATFGDVEHVTSQGQRGRPAHEERRAAVAPKPREAVFRDVHHLGVDESLPRIRGALGVARRCDENAATHGAKLGPRLGLRCERLLVLALTPVPAARREATKREDDDDENVAFVRFQEDPRVPSSHGARRRAFCRSVVATRRLDVRGV